MKTAGIIVEYNPFHNGHKYHLDTVKERSGADYVVAVMSGNFMQRGAPALIDKYARAEMALLNGADLVLELPFCFACGSAEYFAAGAVSLLDRLGIINTLGFGSECGDTDLLDGIARIVDSEPPAYKARLKSCLREGKSFPAARQEALAAVSPSPLLPSGEAGNRLFSSPNNILGIEYCRALRRQGSRIRPLTICRKGAGYAEAAFREPKAEGGPELTPLEQAASDVPCSSALAIRAYLAGGSAVEGLKGQVPDNVLSILSRQFGKTFPLYEDDFSQPLLYKLLLEESGGYLQYADVTPEIARRIRNRLPEFKSFSQFCGLLKTKDVTYTRISRCLCHILIDLKKEDLAAGAPPFYAPYARILGLRRESRELFTALKHHSSIPLLSKLSAARSQLAAPAYRMLETDILAGQIYDAAAAQKFGGNIRRELTRKLCII